MTRHSDSHVTYDPGDVVVVHLPKPVKREIGGVVTIHASSEQCRRNCEVVSETQEERAVAGYAVDSRLTYVVRTKDDFRFRIHEHAIVKQCDAGVIGETYHIDDNGNKIVFEIEDYLSGS